MINYDNAVFNGINKVVYMTYASALWFLFSLPVVTIGASTTALYYTIYKVVRNETGKVFEEFLRSFKSNFKQSTIVYAVFAAIVSVGLVDCFVLNMYLENGMLFKVSICIVLLLVIGTAMAAGYAFPYIARFENTTKLILINTIYILITHFIKSIGLLFIFVAAFLLVLINPVFLAFSPGLYMFCASYIIEPIFRKYMTAEDLEEEQKKYEIRSDI